MERKNQFPPGFIIDTSRYIVLVKNHIVDMFILSGTKDEGAYLKRKFRPQGLFTLRKYNSGNLWKPRLGSQRFPEENR
jgi:hypothetical protein